MSNAAKSRNDGDGGDEWQLNQILYADDSSSSRWNV
jgi:hypothetical protein